MHTAAQPGVPPAAAPVIFEKVSLGFEGVPVLKEVSFALEHGETKVLLGESGSGKSVILKLALGLLKPDSGKIYILGHEITGMKEEDLFELRRQIGMVFQESALFDSLNVEENVAFRLYEEHVPYAQIHPRVIEVLRFVELVDTVELFPAELSGGMRRRVAIARAIISDPEILLYDSPTGGLDPVTSTTIIELLVKQRDVYQASALLVTHRLQDALLMATHRFNRKTNRMEPIQDGEVTENHTKFLMLRDCRIIFQGTAAELAASKDPYIRDYLS
jgi:phospholipid/cholesterol/gamma-HCH transport system ATP-binding protein